MLRSAETKPNATALTVQSETFGRSDLTWAELRRQVASVAHHLKGMGVGQGDRVVAILPNTETAMIAFLATASLGARSGRSVRRIWAMSPSWTGSGRSRPRF